jgi:hypothetical protein
MSKKEKNEYKKMKFDQNLINELAWCLNTLQPIQKHVLFINSRKWFRIFHSKDEMIGCIAHELAHMELSYDRDIEIQLDRQLAEKAEASKLSARCFNGHNFTLALHCNEYLADALAIGRGFGRELSAQSKAIHQYYGNRMRRGIPYEVVEEHTGTHDLVRYKIARKDEVLHISGLVQYNNGASSYYGDFKDNNADGKGKRRSNGSGTVVGDFAEDKVKYGVLSYDSGDYYDGCFNDRCCEGRGRHYYADGAVYDGMWKGNRYHGKGTLYAVNGSVYKSGIWDMGRLTVSEKCDSAEFAFIRMPEGGEERMYHGDIKDGQYHGTGKLVMVNGDTYIGGFENGWYTKGVFINKAFGHIAVGSFRENMLHGHARLYYNNDPEKCVYDGNYEDGHRHGHGIMYYSDGTFYDGEWDKGKPVETDVSGKPEESLNISQAV